MNHHRILVFVALLFAAPQIKAEFLNIDMSIFGMD